MRIMYTVHIIMYNTLGYPNHLCIEKNWCLYSSQKYMTNAMLDGEVTLDLGGVDNTLAMTLLVLACLHSASSGNVERGNCAARNLLMWALLPPFGVM